MIRLGLRLTVAGGREAINRLVLIIVAVAVGVTLLLGTLAGLNGVQAQNDRFAWLETGFSGSDAPIGHPAAHPPLLWRLRADYFDGKTIGRVDLAATGSGSPVPPGIPALPGAGEFYASPALAALLRTTPANELADRYPGRLIGTIRDVALPSPDSTIIVIGHAPAQLRGLPGVRRVDRISTTVPGDCSGDCAVGVGTNYRGLVLILAVVVAALLFPVLILVGGATRLSAARREQRFAAMRLVGATPGQITTIATVESALATVVGVLAGLGMFFATRPLLAKIPFTGDRFFLSDVSLNALDVALVVIGIPLGAVVAARLALRRVTVSPLGVTRRVTRKPPRAWRAVPLLAGIAELGYFAYFDDIGAQSGTSPTIEAVAFLLGVLLVMAGIVIAGPWLTMLASRLAVRRANRPATLLASRRLADDPHAGFRAISGVVLAVFVGTCATAIITAIVADSGDMGAVDPRLAHTLVDMIGGPGDNARVTSLTPATTTRLAAIDGVGGTAVIRDRPISAPPPGVPTNRHQHLVRAQAFEQLVSCAQIDRVPALGKCPPGAAVVSISPDFGGGFLHRSAMPDITWPAADVSLASLSRLPIDTIAVDTDGSRAAIEAARTVLDVAYPSHFAAQSVSEIHASKSQLLSAYRRLAEVVVLASLPIAGCSLAVNIVGGLADRRRPFSLLRLSGTPLRVLRRVVGVEAAAPMLLTAVASVGAGLLAAQLFLRAQLRESLHPLGVAFYAILAAGLVVSLLIAASALPLLNRMTGPEIARND